MARPKNKLLDPNELQGPFNQQIMDYIRKTGMDGLNEFADKFGIGRTTMYDLVLKGSTRGGKPYRPSIEILLKLAEALEIPVHELLYQLEPDAFGAEVLDEYPPIRMVPILAASPRIPVVGQVGAGPDQSDQLEESLVIEESFARGKNLVAFRVFGNSMEGGRNPIFDGDLVLVNTLDKGTGGSTVVARLAGDGYVCKRLVADATAKPLYLTSTNSEYVDAEFAMITADRVEEITGAVVRVIRDIQSAS